MCSTSSRPRAGPATFAGAGSEDWRRRSDVIRAPARTFAWSGPILGTDRLSLKVQSFTDFDTDRRILEAASAALRDGYNQYATTWGAPQLRQAVAKKQSAAWGRD